MSNDLEACPRCDREPVDMMDSILERGGKICFLCAEDEVCRPGYVRRMYLNIETPERRKRITPMVRGRKFRELNIDNTRLKEADPTKIHLSHPACHSVSACSFERYNKSVLTHDPYQVTCGHCLRILRRSGGSSD